MHVLRFMFFSFFCSIFFVGASATEESKSFLDEYSPIAIETMCSKEYLLEKIGLDPEECRQVVEKADEYCRIIAEPIEPESDFDESDTETTRRARSFSVLYFHCLYAATLMHKNYDEPPDDITSPDRNK